MIQGTKEQLPDCFHTGITYGNKDSKDLYLTWFYYFVSDAAFYLMFKVAINHKEITTLIFLLPGY